MMIEKLPFTEIHSGGEDMVDRVEFRPVSSHEMQHKINELVDAVNELQKDYDNVCVWVGEQKLKTPAKNIPESIKLYVCADGSMYDNEDVAKSHAASIFNPLPAGTTTTDQVYLEQDPYAEQRKWIGCLCRFRYGLGVTPTYGILGKISPNSDFPYYKKDTDTYWKYCEPVKPDDDIIYKGSDNE